MKNRPITICGVTIQPGERLTLAMPTPAIYTCAPLHIPMHVIHGKKEGPRLLICATLYGDEVNGIDIVNRLLHLSSLKNLSGTLLCIPVMNVYGLINHKRFLPDGRDLAESFPGSNEGSFAARLAHLFSSEIIDHMTHCINIRSGARHTYRLPEVYYHPEDIEAQAMAKAFGAPVMTPSDEKTGFFYTESGKPKVPTIIYGGGEALRSDEYTIKLGVRGIVKILRKLGMIGVKSKVQEAKGTPLVKKKAFWVRAPLSGLLHLIKSVGKFTEAGERIATITDPFGSTERYDVVAPSSGMITAINTHPFLRMALFAALSASVSGGIVGSYVVVKRIVFISGSIAHSVLGGLGAALYISRVYHVTWLKPIHGALIAAILAAWLIGTVRLYYREREDTVIAALWAFGMSIGVILISLTPGATIEISNYLFGNILWASSSDLYMLLGLDLVVLAVVALFHRRFLAICFDEKQAALQGQNVKLLYFLLLLLVALTIVLMIQVVGAILIVAILSLPAAIANTYTHRLSKMMGLAVLISSIISFLGLLFSYALNWPPGATIALTATTIYLLNLLRKK